MGNDQTINIGLNKHEVLVLFEFLGRFKEFSENPYFEDQSEQRVLFNMESILEKKLVEPFSKGYGEQLKKAREIVRYSE